MRVLDSLDIIWWPGLGVSFNIAAQLQWTTRGLFPRIARLRDGESLHATAIRHHHSTIRRDAENAHDLMPEQCLASLTAENGKVNFKRPTCEYVATTGLSQW